MKRYHLFLLFLLIIGLNLVAISLQKVQENRSRAATTTVVNCTVDSTKIALDTEEQAFLTLINTYRQQHNAGPLKFSDNLNKAAAWMSHDMQTHNSFSHTDSLNRTPATRMTNCGYTGPGTGENLADGSLTSATTAQQVFNLWKASPPHNTNMLNTEYVVIGVAREANSTTMYWTSDFGTTDDTRTATPTVKPTSTPTMPPTATGLSLTVFLDGIGKAGDSTNPTAKGNLNPHSQLRTIHIDIYTTNNTLLTSTQAVLPYVVSSGNFVGTAVLNQLSSGTYIIKVKADRYLRKTISGSIAITKGKLNQLPAVTLIAGDINGDNSIDIRDYNELMGCFADLQPAVSCTNTQQIASDLTDDTVVNQYDYNLFIREIAVRTGD